MSYAHPARHMKEKYRSARPRPCATPKLTIRASFTAPRQIQVPESASACRWWSPHWTSGCWKLRRTHVDGTITWMDRRETLEEPSSRNSRRRRRAGRPAPRIVAGVPTAIVSDVDAARRASTRAWPCTAARFLSRHARPPRGAEGPSCIAMSWAAKRISRKQIQRLRDIGVNRSGLAILGVGDHHTTVELSGVGARSGALSTAAAARVPFPSPTARVPARHPEARWRTARARRPASGRWRRSGHHDRHRHRPEDARPVESSASTAAQRGEHNRRTATHRRFDDPHRRARPCARSWRI